MLFAQLQPSARHDSFARSAGRNFGGKKSIGGDLSEAVVDPPTGLSLVIWWYMFHICYNILWKLLRDCVYYIYTEIKYIYIYVLYVLINYIAIILESRTDIFMYIGSIGTPWINPKLYIFGMVNQDQPRRNCEGDLTPNTKHQGRRTVLMRIWPEAHTLTILKATRMTIVPCGAFIAMFFGS